MASECDQLHTIAVTIIRTAKVNVIIDNTLPTAMTDFQNIYVTDALAPPELHKYERVMCRIRDGQVAHEAGHIVITKPVKKQLMVWEARQPNQRLANLVHQGLEDKRTNYFILQRYRFDYAFRLQLLADVTNRLWVDSLKLQLVQMRNANAATAMLPEEQFVNLILIPISFLKGMWGLNVEKEFIMTKEQKEFVNKVAKIFDEARFDKMVMSIINRHQQLYDLLEERINQKPYEQPESHCPKSLGGDLILQSGQATKKAVAKMEKALVQAEKEAAEAAAKDGAKKGKQGIMAIGSGSGLNIPSPTPDQAEYLRLVQKNRTHIERLLNLLKRLIKPKLLTDKWRKQGRFMNEILAKAYAASARRAVQDVYASRTMQLQKTEAVMGLIVDLSGSVKEEDAKDSLTVISEVCGRWLRDEDFAIMVFGSEYQKIKAYVEPYHTTKLRIGGVKCLGGTELYQPLNEMYQMMKAQKNHRDKILMIVSDFYVDKPDECKKLIKTIESDGIKVIGLGIDGTKEDYIKEYCQNAKYIGTICELPEAVFDLYRNATY